MSNKTNFDDIEAMKGKTYQYGNNIHYVLGVFIDYDKEKCFIKTNIENFDRPLASVREFLRYWQPTSNITTVVSPVSPNQNEMQFDLCIAGNESFTGELIATLNDTITKVKNNREYVPQALVINKNINSLIQIAKLRLDFAKHFSPNFKK